MEVTLRFKDLGSSSEAVAMISRFEGSIEFVFGVEGKGELDLTLKDEDARRLVDAIVFALDSA